MRQPREKDKFLKHKHSNLKQEEIENLNRGIMSNKIESVIKIIPNKANSKAV